jgi:hypothetical protein
MPTTVSISKAIRLSKRLTIILALMGSKPQAEFFSPFGTIHRPTMLFLEAPFRPVTNYAGGLKFIVLSAVLYAPGTALCFWARREQNKPMCTKPSDWIIFGLAVVGASVGIYWLATDYITI